MHLNASKYGEREIFSWQADNVPTTAYTSLGRGWLLRSIFSLYLIFIGNGECLQGRCFSFDSMTGSAVFWTLLVSYSELCAIKRGEGKWRRLRCFLFCFSGTQGYRKEDRWRRKSELNRIRWAIGNLTFAFNAVFCVFGTRVSPTFLFGILLMHGRIREFYRSARRKPTAFQTQFPGAVHLKRALPLLDYGLFQLKLGTRHIRWGIRQIVNKRV